MDYLTGRVGNAYRALLSGGDVSEFAKHNWLLKYNEPAAVYRLIRRSGRSPAPCRRFTARRRT